ncbi:MAG: DNA polymerase III subunit delta' [Anaerolineae bacterium]
MTTHHNWDIIGHEWAVEMLSWRLANNREAHAYLITGLQGIGKSLLARRLAQAINCAGDPRPCRVCRPCDLTERLVHPDVLIVEPEGASIKIAAMRDLQGFLTMRPFEARCRVVLLLDVDKATGPAMDALLKTLEEPPATARLILTASSAGALLPTIVSRCQVIPLRPVPAPQIEAALIERQALPPDVAATLARLSGGRPGWALSAAQTPAILELRAATLESIQGVLYASRVSRFAYAEQLAAHSEREMVLNLWRTWWRDVVLLAEGSTVPPVNGDHGAALQAAAARVGREAARQALLTVHRTITLLATTNVNSRLALEVMLLDMPYLG